MFKRLLNIAFRIFCVLMAILFIAAVLGIIFIYNDLMLIPFLAFAAFFCVLIWCLYKIQLSFKISVILIFSAALILRLLSVSMWQIAPASDFLSTYNIAEKLASANLADYPSIISASKYSVQWSIHLPFILFETLILKLFGYGTYSLSVIFVIFSALSSICTAYIAKHLYGEKAGIIAGTIFALSPSSIFFAPVLTNQHAATFFFLAGVWIFVAKPFERHYVNLISFSVCGNSAAYTP